jgi:DMSO/TMAO reductase YedYZ heme-binding membrane subunit
MTPTKRLLLAAGAAALTFALLFGVCRLHLATRGLPSGLALIPFYLLLPAEALGEAVGRAAFLVTGFLQFFLLWWLALGSWGWMRSRTRG